MEMVRENTCLVMKKNGILFPKVCENPVPVLRLMFQEVSLHLKQFFAHPATLLKYIQNRRK